MTRRPRRHSSTPARTTRTLSRKQEEDELQKVKEDEGEEEEEENDNAADLHRAHYRRHSRE